MNLTSIFIIRCSRKEKKSSIIQLVLKIFNFGTFLKSQILCQIKPALHRNEKVKCGDCGIMYVCQQAARHQKRCAKGVISCPDCKYSAYNQQEMNYHMAKKHAQPSSKQSTVCPSCEQEFPSYFSLQQHRRKEHGAKQWKPSDTVADLNKIVEEEGEDGEKLKEELSACQHFLVDTEMENGRQSI